MGNLTESAIWEDNVNQIETSDQLLGGPTGPMNLGPKQLANRTKWLKQALQGFTQITAINANHILTVSELLQSLVVVNAASHTLNLTLPDSSDGVNPIPVGFNAVITAQSVDTGQVSLHCGGSDHFLDGQISKTSLYLGDADLLQLIWTGSGWLVTERRGNFDCVGDVELQYKVKRNTLIAQGQLVSRSAYPRLWEWVQTLGASLIDDATWASPGNNGFYSTGDGNTNFRLPDLRSMFLRGLDLGKGIDFSRLSANPGGYEADAIKEHTHMTVFDDFESSTGHPGDVGNPLTTTRPMIRYFLKTSSGGPESYELAGTSANNTQPNISPTSKTGGVENLVKNIGLLPLIKI